MTAVAGLRLTYGPWGETLAELVDAAAAAEAAGAQVVWAPEMHRSATVTAAAMASGSSMLPRVHSSSQRRLQMRPQTAGKGFSFLMSSRASVYRPCAASFM